MFALEKQDKSCIQFSIISYENKNCLFLSQNSLQNFVIMINVYKITTSEVQKLIKKYC